MVEILKNLYIIKYASVINMILKVVFIILGIVVLTLCVLLGKYTYDNMHFDEMPLKLTKQAGFVEKQKTLSNGILLNYAEGPNNGPVLFLIHGQGMQWQDYSKVLSQLSKYYHVFAVDCEGHGKSSHDPSRYTCTAIGQDFVLFIKNVIGEPCIVSGHSSGGILAAWIAANCPDFVKGLVLEDPPFFSVEPDEMQNTFVWKDSFVVTHNYLIQEPNESYSVYYFQHSYLWHMFGGLQNFVAKSAAKYQAAHPGEPIKLWFVPHTMTYGLMYMNHFDLKFAETFYTGSWFDGISQLKILSEVKCPSVYIKAKTRYGNDGVLWAANTDEGADRVHNLLKGNKRITIISGHDIHFEKPDEFVHILTDFRK